MKDPVETLGGIKAVLDALAENRKKCVGNPIAEAVHDLAELGVFAADHRAEAMILRLRLLTPAGDEINHWRDQMANLLTYRIVAAKTVSAGYVRAKIRGLTEDGIALMRRAKENLP